MNEKTGYTYSFLLYERMISLSARSTRIRCTCAHALNRSPPTTQSLLDDRTLSTLSCVPSSHITLSHENLPASHMPGLSQLSLRNAPHDISPPTPCPLRLLHILPPLSEKAIHLEFFNILLQSRSKELCIPLINPWRQRLGLSSLLREPPRSPFGF
jgi:hypothetical protein